MSVEPAEFSLSQEETDDGAVAVITVVGELDLGSVSEFEQALARAAGKGGALVIDMTALAFMDSSGLRALLLSCERFAAAGRLLGIAAADGSAVRHLFSVSGVEDRLSLFSAREDAIGFAQGDTG